MPYTNSSENVQQNGVLAENERKISEIREMVQKQGQTIDYFINKPSQSPEDLITILKGSK